MYAIIFAKILAQFVVHNRSVIGGGYRKNKDNT